MCDIKINSVVGVKYLLLRGCYEKTRIFKIGSYGNKFNSYGKLPGR